MKECDRFFISVTESCDSALCPHCAIQGKLLPSLVYDTLSLGTVLAH